MKYKLSWATALEVDGLIDYCESLDIVFDKFREEEGYKIYHTWIESEDMVTIKLKFPELGFREIPDKEGS